MIQPPPDPSWAPDFMFRLEPIAWVQHFFGLGHPLPFLLLDLIASVWGVLFALGLALWLWGREDVYAVAGIVIAEGIVNFALNQFLHVPRPAGPSIVVYQEVGLSSFPSGHAFTVTLLWGLLWVRGRVPFWLAALLVLTVSVSRLYLGAHYLADVVVGTLNGILLVWLFHRGWPAVRRWLGGRSYRALARGGIAAAAIVVAGAVLFATPSHFTYNAAALFAGGAVALVLEYRAVRYDPATRTPGRDVARIAVGLLGIVPLLAVDRLTPNAWYLLGAALMFLGALWALLAYPALLMRRRMSSADAAGWPSAARPASSSSRRASS